MQDLDRTCDEKCSRATSPNTAIMEWLLLRACCIIAPWNIWIYLAWDPMQAGHTSRVQADAWLFGEVTV